MNDKWDRKNGPVWLFHDGCFVLAWRHFCVGFEAGGEVLWTIEMQQIRYLCHVVFSFPNQLSGFFDLQGIVVFHDAAAAI